MAEEGVHPEVGLVSHLGLAVEDLCLQVLMITMYEGQHCKTNCRMQRWQHQRLALIGWSVRLTMYSIQ